MCLETAPPSPSSCIMRPATTFKNCVYLLTYSTVQIPSWEANWFAASQEIPHILWNPNVHYRTHKRPPTVPILGQPNPVHIPTSYLLEIHLIIIHPSTPRSNQWFLSLRFYINCVYIIKMPQKFSCLCLPYLVIFARTAHEQMHNNPCGPLPQKVGHPWPSTYSRTSNETAYPVKRLLILQNISYNKTFHYALTLLCHFSPCAEYWNMYEKK